MSLRRSCLRPPGDSPSFRPPQGRASPRYPLGGRLGFESPLLRLSNILAEREGFARRGSGDLACAYPAARLPFALRKVGLLLANRSAASSRSNPRISVCQTSWRRGRDSNPRGGYKPPTRFPVAFLRPARTPLREYSCAKITAEGSGSNPHASVVKHLGGGSRIRPMGLRRSRLTPPQF